MPRIIKIERSDALTVVRDMKQLDERITKFQKDQQEKFQREHNEFMEAAHKEHLENLNRLRFAAGISHSLDGWTLDGDYVDFGVAFLVQSPNAEIKEQHQAMAEKAITKATEQ